MYLCASTISKILHTSLPVTKFGYYRRYRKINSCVQFIFSITVKSYYCCVLVVKKQFVDTVYKMTPVRQDVNKKNNKTRLTLKKMNMKNRLSELMISLCYIVCILYVVKGPREIMFP